MRAAGRWAGRHAGVQRELGALYAAWKRADRAGKQRIVAEPLLVIRALSAMAEAAPDEARRCTNI
jgi:hypothetical protein